MKYIMPYRMVTWISGCVALLMVGALLGFVPASVAHAASLTVTKTADTNDGTCNGDCSLREAINAANKAPGADTITVPAGTYTLARPGAGEDANATGDLDVNSDLTITGALSTTTIIDGGALDRVLHVLGGAKVTISNVTIRNGDAHLAGGGAGIYNSGNLTLRQVIVANNSSYVVFNNAAPGGGVYNAGTLAVEQSRFTNNSSGNGGGIYNTGTLSVTGSLFDTNASHYSMGGGGAISGGGNITITNSTLRNNFAENYIYHGPARGGALGLTGSATLTKVSIVGNTSDGGGGINVEQYATVTIADSTISGNKGVERGSDVNDGRGGGVFNAGNLTLTNTSVSNNQATTGGGIWNSSTLNVFDSTISGNTANKPDTTTGNGAGIWNSGSLSVSTSTINANLANEDGGGVLNTGSANIGGTTIDSNKASVARRGARGGGLLNDGGTLNLGADTISRNDGFLGGGIYNTATLYINASTISGNTGYNGAAINDTGNSQISSSTIVNNSGVLSGITSSYSPQGEPLLSVTNTIVAFTTCGGPIFSRGSNLDSGNTCGLRGNGGGDLINTDPKLGPLANNGGSTLTHLPQPGSPVIDAGTSRCDGQQDQRGVNRPQGVACDIGAVEVFTLNPPTLPNGSVGQPYSAYVSALGTGRDYYRYTVSSGSLPPGLSLASNNGLISGTPTSAGSFTFAITATGYGSNVGSRTYTVVISGGGATGSFPNLPVLDAFNRANGPLGSNWSGDVGGYQIIKNEVDVLGGGGIYWRAAQFGTRQAAFLTLRKVDPNAREIDLILKAQVGSGTDYRQGILLVSYNPAAKAVQIATYRPGAGWLDSPTQPLTLADGDTFGSSVDELGVVRVFKNKQLAATFTLTAPEQQFFNGKGGAIGLWFIDGGNAFFDDFGGGQLP